MVAFEEAFKRLDRKGTILLFAIPSKDITIPTCDFWRNEMTVTSSYGAAPQDLEESLKLIPKLPIKELITHHYPLEKIQDAFELVAAYRDGVMKAMITFD